jgi:hypothetical protein
MKWANNFDEIENTIAEREDIKKEMLTLIKERDIAGKVLEGGNRLNNFRLILKDLTEAKITFQQTIRKTELNLPQTSSIHRDNGRVFTADWAERLVKLQFSRFYNQAVMNLLLNSGETQCYVPVTPTQRSDSTCAKELAGEIHSIKLLLTRLINSYENGNFSKDPKVPNHLHCSHVVKSIK